MPSPTTHGKGLDIPADGVEFELTLTTAPDPIGMVRGDGYSNAADWKYNGKGIVVPVTRRFELVRTGYQPNLARVRQKLGEDNVLEGQWREAFRQVYRRPDGKGPIGFPDPAWERPDGGASFPVLREYGEAWDSDFHWAGRDHDGFWRWLRACK